MQKANNKNHK